MAHNYKLDIYEVIDGTDDWPLIGAVYGNTETECIDKAEANYGSNNEYHWTTPVEN